MEKTNRSLLSSLAPGLRRSAACFLTPLLLLGTLLTGCRAVARGPAPGLQASAPAVSAAAASAHAGCGEGLLVASAWECLRTGLRAPQGDAQP